MRYIFVSVHYMDRNQDLKFDNFDFKIEISAETQNTRTNDGLGTTFKLHQ